MFIYALEMRYGVTLRSLSAHIDTHSLLLSTSCTCVPPHCFGICTYFSHVVGEWAILIIHYMLVSSRYDVLYEYCGAAARVFVLLF